MRGLWRRFTWALGWVWFVPIGRLRFEWRLLGKSREFRAAARVIYRWSKYDLSRETKESLLRDGWGG